MDNKARELVSCARFIKSQKKTLGNWGPLFGATTWLALHKSNSRFKKFIENDSWWLMIGPKISVRVISSSAMFLYHSSKNILRDNFVICYLNYGFFFFFANLCRCIPRLILLWEVNGRMQMDFWHGLGKRKSKALLSKIRYYWEDCMRICN